MAKKSKISVIEGVEGYRMQDYCVSMVAGMCWVVSTWFDFKHQVTGITRLVLRLGSFIS